MNLEFLFKKCESFMKSLHHSKIFHNSVIYFTPDRKVRNIMQILLIQNNITLAKDLAEFFSQNHDTLDMVTNGNDGLLYAHSPIYDLILLHSDFPDLDVLSFITTLRQEHIVTPLILLAENASVNDMVRALNAGADDYFTSSLSIELFLARVRALSRRNTVYHGNILNFHDLFLNIGTMELSCNQQGIKLGLKETKICELLLSSPNQIIPKNLLIEKIWGMESDATYNNVEVHISFLRTKLKKLNTDVKIKTVRGVGYQLIT